LEDELVVGVECRGDGVLREGCEVGEQALEAVNRESVGGRAASLLGDGGGGALSLGDDAGSQFFGGLLVGIVVEHRSKALAHVPFDVIGEHAQTDVGAHARHRPMEDRSDLKIDRLDTADGALHLSQTLVGPDAGAVVEGLGRQAGADHIDAVEARLGGDRILLASEGKVGVGDGEQRKAS